MSHNVDLMRGMLTGGGARPTQFDIILTNPIDSSGDYQLKFKGMSANLPGAVLGEIPVYYFGRQIFEAGDRTYESWTVTILNDEDFAVRNALERWNNAINDRVANIRTDGAGISGNSYKSIGMVIQYSKSGNPIKGYELTGIWPKNLSPIEVSWQSVDQVEQFTCEFRFDYHRPIGLNEIAAKAVSITL
jgi:hypothetical protein